MADKQDHLAYPPRLLRPDSAARYLSMGTSTFLRMVAEGKLPKPKRIGGIVAWDRWKLDAYVDDTSDDDPGVNTVEKFFNRS